MNNPDIMRLLYERLQEEGLYFLVSLDEETLLKDELWDAVNENYRKYGHKGPEDKLITSRYILDHWTARLQGAGLVDVREIGRARMYHITQLGKAMIDYAQKQGKKE